MFAPIGYLALAFVVAFLLGSIPWGVVISRLVYHKDLRDEGSGNIGTTNAMRALGKVGGAAVFVLDFGKGLLAGYLGVVFASYAGWAAIDATAAVGLAPADLGHPVVNMPALAMALSFAGCTLGHIFSPWLGGHGGKGIAVAAACLAFVYGPVGFAIEVGCFAVLVVLTRYVSVGSIAAAAICPLLGLYFFWGQWAAWLVITATAGVVIWAHRANIARLRAGNENRIGSKKKAA